jgi:alpha-tubulin suppressor-like RCC1 family protein
MSGPVLQTGAGDAHTCALMHDHHVMCWGWNNSGQLGDGSTSMRAIPALVPGFEDVAEIALGPSRTCARTQQGDVMCVTRTAQPARIEGVTDATALSLSGSHACALVRDGTLRCWGRNRAGELGNGTMNERADVVAIVW